MTRQYYDETGQVKYYQILLPKYLLKELLQAIQQYMARHIATRAFLKCYRKFAKNSTTSELQNSSKNG